MTGAGARADAPERLAGLPAGVGIGFKPEHFPELAGGVPGIAFLEVHAENYMGDGGVPHRQLAALREHYALSVHGVGLSIGGPGPLDAAHLDRLARLCARHQPESFSEHLAWSTHEGAFLNDLLPLPYTGETLALVAGHVDAVQSALGRPMLLENPSSYLRFTASTWSETDFLREVVRRTGCGLLLDVNNVFVSAANLGSDPLSYIADFPLEAVGEIHLGGHDVEDGPGGRLLVDAHASPVDDAVWALFGAVIARCGPLPTLIERDADVPPLGVLLAEAERAQALMRRLRAPVPDVPLAVS